MEPFDLYDDSPPIIRPEHILNTTHQLLPSTFILFFYKNAFLKSLKNKKKWQGMPPDYYQYNNIGIKRLPMGADISAITLELLIASGVKNFIIFGTACSLQSNINGSDLCLITSAIREDGVSHHYVPYNRTILNTNLINQKLMTFLKSENEPFYEGKSYTTSAFFRETTSKIEKAKQENAFTIDMESASLFAIAKNKKINLSILAFISDKIENSQWQSCKRDWDKENAITKKIISFFSNSR